MAPTHVMEEVPQEGSLTKGWEYHENWHFRNRFVAEWAVRLSAERDTRVAKVDPVTHRWLKKESLYGHAW